MSIIEVTEVRDGPFVDAGDKMVRSTIEEVFVIDTDKIPAFVAERDAGAWRMSFVQSIIEDAIAGVVCVVRDIGETFTDGTSHDGHWYEAIYADEGAEPDIKIEVQITGCDI